MDDINDDGEVWGSVPRARVVVRPLVRGMGRRGFLFKLGSVVNVELSVRLKFSVMVRCF